MKAHLKYWNGSWWCRRMGVTGQGSTPKAAWDDMWELYREAVTTMSCNGGAWATSPRR